ncbi:hypothetical protein B4589_012965 [Halolamina sp. CBA1230]|uniref:hypothetical protein n=1 Tax=Halolamina sp. CBA1230 TaxID=1853690 RepID=UPI0009A1CFB3|nr:hypothetical protein [Halolamina sp. CBA1230]QKY21237.1 hypothetical protein B4589_012965 [Halolamina sp. CBA1230]
MSRRALPALVVLLALSATLTLAAPALAAPPPEPVCTNCEPAYERATDRAGVDATVSRSAAVVSLGEDGNATWRVGLVLDGPDAEELARNDSLHRRIATEAVGEEFVGAGPGRGLNRSGGSGGPRFPDAEHVRYYRFRDSEFARGTVGGAVVVTKFRADLQGENYAGLGVDRLSVHSFLDVTHAPPGVDTVDGLGGSGFTLTERQPGLATFDPVTGVAGHASYVPSLLGLAAVLLPVVVENAAIVVLPALAVHAVVTGGLFALLAGSFPDPDDRWRRGVAGLLGATAGLFTLQPLLAGSLGAPALGSAEPLLLGPAAAFAVVAVGLVRPSLVGDGSPRRLAARALGAGAVAGVVVGTVAPGTTGWTFALWAFDPTPPGATAWDGLGFTLMVAGPTLALLPAGAALAVGRTRAALAVALAGAALGWVASPVLYFAQTGLVVPGFLLGLPAVSAVLVLGAPLLLAGWVLGEQRASTPADA